MHMQAIFHLNFVNCKTTVIVCKYVCDYYVRIWLMNYIPYDGDKIGVIVIGQGPETIVP